MVFAKRLNAHNEKYKTKGWDKAGPLGTNIMLLKLLLMNDCQNVGKILEVIK